MMRQWVVGVIALVAMYMAILAVLYLLDEQERDRQEETFRVCVYERPVEECARLLPGAR